MKAPQIVKFKWRDLKMQTFRNFAFTNPGNVQNQIIPRISIFLVLKTKKDGEGQRQKILSKIFNVSKKANMVFLVDET